MPPAKHKPLCASTVEIGSPANIDANAAHAAIRDLDAYRNGNGRRQAVVQP